MRTRAVICALAIINTFVSLAVVACTQSSGSDGGVDSSSEAESSTDASAQDSETGVGYAIAVGGEDTCVITPSGDLYCWGVNQCGEVGVDPDNDTVPCTQARGTAAIHCHPTPTKVAGLPPVKQVSTRGGTTCAVDVNGGIWCWGSNEWDLLGHPSGFYGDIKYNACPYPYANASPAQIPNIVATTVKLAVSNACAVTTDGGVDCWGTNNLGQSGQPPSADGFSSPTPIPGLSNVQDIALDELSTRACALKTDGTVWCWGDDDVWQLGFGADASAPPTCQQTTQKYCFGTPTRVVFPDEAADAGAQPSNVRSLALPSNAGCVVRGLNGDLWCWGPPPDYLGLAAYSWSSPDAAPSFPPQKVSGMSQLSEVSGSGSICVRGTSGGVWCWGVSDFGELGNGVLDGGAPCKCLGNCSTGNYCTASPVQVPNVNMAAIFTDWSYTVGIAVDGGLVGWGDNTAGATGHPPGTNGDVESCTLSPVPFTFTIP